MTAAAEEKRKNPYPKGTIAHDAWEFNEACCELARLLRDHYIDAARKVNAAWKGKRP